MICTCPEFAPNIVKVNAPLMLLVARQPHTPGYDGVPFRFCPWCAKALIGDDLAKPQLSEPDAAIERGRLLAEKCFGQVRSGIDLEKMTWLTGAQWNDLGAYVQSIVDREIPTASEPAKDLLSARDDVS